jgi:hypothetical protein
MKTVDTATETGAEEKTEEEAPRPKTARETMMEQIDERHDQVLAEQVHQQTPEPAADAEPEAVVVDDPKRFRINIKIGETEEERSLDQVVNELQTSNGRVRSLSSRTKDLEAALAEKDRLLQDQLTAQAQLADAEATDEDIDARVSEVMNALVEGDEEKGAAALRELLRKGRHEATPVDEKALVGKVRSELAREQEQVQAAQVWTSFVEEFPEFRDQSDAETGEPILSEERKYGDYVFERDFAPKVEAGELSYQEALSQTAEAVRKVFAKPAAPEAEGAVTKDPLEARRERKKQIDQLPVAAGGRVAETKEEAGESASDAIREMRKARGLSV